MSERPPDGDVGDGFDTGDDDADLRELRSIAAGLAPLDLDLETPPPGLWERIEQQVEAERGPSIRLVDPIHPEDHDVPGPPPGAAPPREPGGSAGVQRGKGVRWAPWILGAAAALVVIAGIGWSLRGTQSPQVVASAQLELLGATGAGSAELVDADGGFELHVATDGLEAADGFVEVWVIDSEVSRLVSLGPLRPDGVYTLPGGLDPAEFPIVDVSYEPFDGDPAHSGDSVLRGTLEF